MPTMNFYVSEEDYGRVLRAIEAEPKIDGEVMSVTVIATRLVHWFAKAPDAPLRRSALRWG